MHSDRRYNEEELRELMRRATQKQHAAFDRVESGLSLDEIKRIAAEVGVDPSFVELAAKELGDDSVELKQSKLAGAPLGYRVRQNIPGELKDRTMADIAAVIRRHSKQDPGHVETFGSSMTWRSSVSNATSASVEVSAAGGSVTIDASTRMAAYAILLQTPTFILSIVGAILWIAANNATAAIILLSIAAVLFVAMRFAYRGVASSIRGSVDRLVDDVEKVIREGTAPTQQSATFRKSDLLDDVGAYDAEQRLQRPRDKTR